MATVNHSRASTAVLSSARSIFVRMFSKRSDVLLPFIPKSIKIVFLLLVLINSSSFPFTWHVRVWYYPLRAYYLAYTRGRIGYWNMIQNNLKAAGGIKGLRSVIKRKALFDDCDYNLHLSNSCYAKNVDPVRMKYCLEAFPSVFYTGVHMALGASHYIFLKEIPLGSDYSIEIRMGGWGNKWIYLIAEYIIYPKRYSSNKSKSNLKSKSKSATVIASELQAEATDKLKSVGMLVPNISTPASGNITPTRSASVPGSGSGSGAQTPNTSANRSLSHRPREVRPDGGVICCVGVTEYCFKMGRVTIPPRVAMFVGLVSPKEEDRARAIQILNRKDRGKSWLAGGWKEEADADQIGRDIGLVDSNGVGFVGDIGVTSETWVEKGRVAMEKATEGFNMF